MSAGKGEEGRSCCAVKQTAVLQTTDSPAVLGGGDVGGGRDVGAPAADNTERGGLVVCREEGEERQTWLASWSHSIHIHQIYQ